MKKKRLFSVLLAAILILLCVFPLTAGAAEHAPPPPKPPKHDPERVIFFATDIHGREQNLAYLLENVKADTEIATFAFGGDYELSTETIDSYINEQFPMSQKLYVTGNHDYGDGCTSTGEVLITDYFVIYPIAFDDFNNAATAEALYAYLETYNENEMTVGKPLFVLSHLPLHEDRGDNYYGYSYVDALNAFGEEIDIVYLWGHNHTVDRTLYLYQRNETMYAAGGYEEELHFTYATAGYIKEGYSCLIHVGDEALELQRYDIYGKYEDAVSIPRIVPGKRPHNCIKDGHKGTQKAFMPKAKAFKKHCTECEQDYLERLVGDVDGNGTVSAADARLVLRHINKLTVLENADMAVADVDNNTINDNDVFLILQLAVKSEEAEKLIKWIPVDNDGKLLA